MDNKVDIGIPVGKYDITVGDSYKRSADKTDYHTLKVDFKPKSVATDPETYIAINAKDDVQMVVPGETSQWTLFQGSRKSVKNDKECLLIFDKKTGQLRLEKLTSNIQVKKIRGKMEEKLDESVRSEIIQLHEKRVKQKEAAKRSRRSTTESEMNGSSDDSSGSDSGSDSDEEKSDGHSQSDHMELGSDVHENNLESEDDLLESQLEKHLMINKNEYKAVVSPVKQAPSTSNSAITHQKKILHDDLQLSESETSEEE
uniref:Ell-associated factor Eaf n=1 Tax=Acrobeloides nanus TaxID=290746 RepID=A0A914DBR3_9BILA